MIRSLFLDHPASVGESYAEHLLAAGRFGLAMVVGGAACMVHALVPALFERVGSETVAGLYARMVAQRSASRAAQVEMRTVEYVI